MKDWKNCTTKAERKQTEHAAFRRARAALVRKYTNMRDNAPTDKMRSFADVRLADLRASLFLFGY